MVLDAVASQGVRTGPVTVIAEAARGAVMMAQKLAMRNDAAG
jgi:hypothetical protein